MNAAPTLAIGIACIAMTVCSASAQTNRRTIGGGGDFNPSGLVQPIPAAPKKVVQTTVTYLALTKERQWSSSDGKSITATLLSFDHGNEAKFIGPTVIKDGKIHLLKSNKPFVLPLDRLAALDQDEVRVIDKKIKNIYTAKKTAAAAAAAAAKTPE